MIKFEGMDSKTSKFHFPYSRKSIVTQYTILIKVINMEDVTVFLTECFTHPLPSLIDILVDEEVYPTE